eukprot:200739-Pelagomonas_calceolata.AAC.2
MVLLRLLQTRTVFGVAEEEYFKPKLAPDWFVWKCAAISKKKVCHNEPSWFTHDDSLLIRRLG